MKITYSHCVHDTLVIFFFFFLEIRKINRIKYEDQRLLIGLRYNNTSNKIMQLVAQHCCVSRCRVDFARITSLIFVARLCCAKYRRSFYILQQSGFTTNFRFAT